MEGSLVISSDVLLAIFCFEIRHFYGASWVVRKGRNVKFCKKIRCWSNYQTACQRIKQHLLSSNNGFLPGFLTFTLLGELLKMCPKMAAETEPSQRGKTKMVAPALKYEPNWTEKYIFVNHLSRPFICESLRNFIFSRPNDDSWKLERTALKLLHNRQSEIILELPRKNSSNPP